MPDMKLRKTYWTVILEETLTKKPYVKHLVLHLLEGGLRNGFEHDAAKLARECLKNITSEELWQLNMISQIR